MKKHQLSYLVLFFLLLPLIGIAQVGINTHNPDLSAALDISSTTQGFTKSNGLIIKSGDDCYRIKVNNGNVVAEPVNCE